MDGFGLQGLLHEGVPAGIHEGGEVLDAVFHGVQSGFQLQGGQDAGDQVRGGVLLLQDVAEFFDGVSQEGGGDGVIGMAGSDLDEYFLLEVDFPEGEFGGFFRFRKEFHDIFFVTQFHAEPRET